MSKQRVIVGAVLAGKSQREVARLYGVSQPRVSGRGAQAAGKLWNHNPGARSRTRTEHHRRWWNGSSGSAPS